MFLLDDGPLNAADDVLLTAIAGVVAELVQQPSDDSGLDPGYVALLERCRGLSIKYETWCSMRAAEKGQREQVPEA